MPSLKDYAGISCYLYNPAVSHRRTRNLPEKQTYPTPVIQQKLNKPFHVTTILDLPPGYSSSVGVFVYLHSNREFGNVAKEATSIRYVVCCDPPKETTYSLRYGLLLDLCTELPFQQTITIRIFRQKNGRDLDGENGIMSFTFKFPQDDPNAETFTDKLGDAPDTDSENSRSNSPPSRGSPTVTIPDDDPDLQ